MIGKPQGDGSTIALVVLLSPRSITGKLESIEAAEGGYQLSINFADTDEAPDLISMFLSTDAPIKVKFDGPLSGDELMALVECEARSVLVSIDRAVPPPLTAAKVTVLPEPLLATVLEVNPPALFDQCPLVDGKEYGAIVAAAPDAGQLF